LAPRGEIVRNGDEEVRRRSVGVVLRRDFNVGGPEVKEGDRTNQPDDDGDQLEWNWRPRERVWNFEDLISVEVVRRRKNEEEESVRSVWSLYA
jgi:hypothetical protein